MAEDYLDKVDKSQKVYAPVSLDHNFLTKANLTFPPNTTNFWDFNIH